MGVQENAQYVVEGQIADPESPEGVFELPCGLYIEHKDVLITEVHVRSMTGAEEDLLSSRKIKPLAKMDAVIAACIERIGEITDKRTIKRLIKDMTIGDRNFLMFAIRRVSLGDKYPFIDTCPSCGGEQLYSIDISDLEVRRLEDKKSRRFEIVTPSKRKVTFRMMVGHDEYMMDKNRSKGDPLSLAMLCRIETIDGEKATLADVKKLSLRDRHFLRDQFEEKEGGIETSLECVCPLCSHEFDREIDIGRTGFFFPGAVLKAWKKKSSI